MKRCFKCGAIKALDDFYKHPDMPDGHVNKCKECNKIDVSKNYRGNREHYALYEKQRFQKPERKAQILTKQRVRRAKNPDKYFANTLTGNALRDGKLTKQPCEKCGAEAQAHHPDYSKPLEIMWLCRKHHLEEHGKEAYNF